MGLLKIQKLSVPQFWEPQVRCLQGWSLLRAVAETLFCACPPASVGLLEVSGIPWFVGRLPQVSASSHLVVFSLSGFCVVSASRLLRFRRVPITLG